MPETERPVPVPPAPVEFEPRLVETVVRVVLDRGAAGVAPAALLRLRLDHRRALDEIYALPPGEPREAAFRDHYRSLFGFLGFDGRIEGWIDLFPPLRRQLREVLVRSVSAPEAEGVELWESRSGRGRGVPAYLVISLPPRRFAHPAELDRFLLPWLQRATDLLDPRFGAGRHGSIPDPAGAGVSQAVRETYATLWELSARARLVAAGRMEDPDLAAEIARVAAVGGRDPADLLELLGSTEAVSSSRLLALARELSGSAVEVEASPERCPLCSFPTLAWATSEALSAFEGAIREDHPGWRPAHGCCGHCIDRHVGLAALRR